MQAPIIRIEKLSKKYRGADFFSLQELNLEIDSREIFGLLGPNGAGKTSLLSILCGLLKPSSGKIQIKGLHFQNNKKEIQQIIGVVPQEYALYPTLSAYENLSYFGSMYGLKGKKLKNNIDQQLHLLGLNKFADKRISTFSGGMKRRVNLIAGILHQPEILFLDEPTVGVDVQSKNVIFAHLKTLNEKGTTIFYTSHHLSEAEDFCSRVAILDEGKILTEGTPTALIDKIPEAKNLEDVFISFTGKALRDYA